ncbi:MAG: hypothetical protein F4W94_02975 [Acidimicrobiia bacterium]|nr:DUF6036 family nucleotidyltransferase [bacterium]MDE0674388.1 DUF6036 family nucleotidyltransferase [bacterium]MYA39561.1 hypothetical protein [Acidimicrobiia bacterium]MYD40693.1 hypothetical protein [Acidimicrobiia bacterium]MYH06338.1 hypothetical protein [Acidimicrobiia bacterium]
MASVDLTPPRIIELFQQVDAQLCELTDRNHDVMIAGGAAVALLWDNRRITNDVDVVSEGMTPLLRSAIARVARDYDLEPGWFNDAAKLHAPALPVDNPIPVFDGERLRVYAVPARYALAMKLVSARDVDKWDIPALLSASDIETREELYRLVQDAYPSQMKMIPAATTYIIDQAWKAHQQSRVGSGE